MVPHKTKRGAAALDRLKVFEGVPAPYDKVKRVVVPSALQVLRLQHGHKFCKLGDLAASVSRGPGVNEGARALQRCSKDRHELIRLEHVIRVCALHRMCSCQLACCARLTDASGMWTDDFHDVSLNAPAHASNLSLTMALLVSCSGWLEAPGGSE